MSTVNIWQVYHVVPALAALDDQDTEDLNIAINWLQHTVDSLVTNMKTVSLKGL